MRHGVCLRKDREDREDRYDAGVGVKKVGIVFCLSNVVG